LFTRGAGASPHHVVLVWPFPVLLVAIGFAEASRFLGRIGDQLLVVVVLFLAGTSALVTNEYFSSLVRNGGGAVWTDAIYPLSDYLKTSKPQVVYINDWGILNVVRLLTEGQLPLQVGSDPLNKPTFDKSDRRILLDRISESRAVFVTHTDQNEM